MCRRDVERGIVNLDAVRGGLLALANGDGIPIEQRDAREVTHGLGKQTAPDGIKVYNPAFDVTPAHLIAGIITEKGIIRPVNEAAIRKVLQSERDA